MWESLIVTIPQEYLALIFPVPIFEDLHQKYQPSQLPLNSFGIL